jgi:hypothetical protein
MWSFLQLSAVMGFFSVVKWAVLGSGHLYIQFHTFAVLGLAFGGVVAVSIGYLSGLVACRVSNRALFGVAGFMYMAPFTTGGGFASYGLFGYPGWLPTYVLGVAPIFLRISKTALITLFMSSTTRSMKGYLL